MNAKLLLALALAALALPAAAQDRSPKWGSFEIGAGTYTPDLDSEFATRPGPYERILGGGSGWMFRLGASKAIFANDLGAIEVGLRTGYFQKNGKGLIEQANPDGTSVLVPSPDKTTLAIVPTSATVTLRLDWLAEHYRFVPLSFYGRAAFERYNWWVTGGTGDWSKKGATNGWSVTGGAALLLDAFDPGLARELDNDTGVNHTYLFFDVTRAQVDDFGSGKSWNLSTDGVSLQGGLMLVF
ncbi:MXAN_2562 family outer membrane beta-barrel protein [Anaeromyxobacter sp. SG66]|uniref:MXAN_2562 family outer membrane beta-barrel protein n=1 Tax=Anaeromyxobacter sp. SG66 TaxID=2925410 RepID=UPI001F56D483|nr:MXAN_2562 family outer membrane beta-barrel protein [Anaeromyxobacter sp. SG66]